jgi:hypothetical protein
MRSGFPAMVARLEVGGRTGGRPICEIDEHCIEAAERERPIRRALEQLSARDLQVLRAAFCESMRELPAFGRVTGVVPLVTSAQVAWRDSRTAHPFEAWLVRLADRVARRSGDHCAADAVLARTIRMEAEHALCAALRAFLGARKRRATR